MSYKAGIAASATVVTLAAADAVRTTINIKNSDDAALLYVKFGSGATTSVGGYHFILQPGDRYARSSGGIYKGIITGIWASATGTAYVDNKSAEVYEPLDVFSSIATQATLADATLADQMTVAVAAGGTYEWEAFLAYTAPAADDLSVKVTAPSGATGNYAGMGQTSALAAAQTSGLYGTAQTWGGNAGTVATLVLRGSVIISTTAGNIAVQVAKAADAGADGTLEVGSFLRVRRIA